MAIQIHTFTKDDMGWYISSIPEPNPFSRGNLAMVAGADTFLDILSQGESKVTLSLSTDKIEGWEVLRRTELIGGVIGSVVNGAMYSADKYREIEYNHSMWLCPVTIWVFNHYPQFIYYQVV